MAARGTPKQPLREDSLHLSQAGVALSERAETGKRQDRLVSLNRAAGLELAELPGIIPGAPG